MNHSPTPPTIYIFIHSWLLIFIACFFACRFIVCLSHSLLMTLLLCMSGLLNIGILSFLIDFLGCSIIAGPVSVNDCAEIYLGSGVGKSRCEAVKLYRVSIDVAEYLRCKSASTSEIPRPMATIRPEAPASGKVSQRGLSSGCVSKLGSPPLH